MSQTATFSPEQDVLRFSGNLTLARIGDLAERLRAYDGKVSAVDLSGVDRMDTVGAWIVQRFASEHDATIEGLSDDGRHC